MAAIGIDLGTTRSSIAYFDGNEPKIIPNIFGESFIPSKVILTKDGRFFVGRDAEVHPEKYESHHFTINAIKRMLHKTDGFVLYGKRHYPQIVSALILAELKRQAEDFLKTTVDEAVICIPCNFGVIQRCATIEAAEIAGFKVLRILNEATAAALAYNFLSGGKYEGRELVFDLGGGTLDLSLMDIWGEGGLQVLTIDGEEFLGGEDFDVRIVEYIVEETKRIQGFDPIEDQTWFWSHIAKLRLKEAAEQAKIDLSFQDKAKIDIPYIRNVLCGRQHIDLELTDQKFKSLCGDLIDKILKLVEGVIQPLRDSGHGTITREVRKKVVKQNKLMDKVFLKKPIEEEITEQIQERRYLPPKFVFTGGASKMKCIKERIKSKYPNVNYISRDKDLVSLGAAVQAGIMKGLCKNWVILDCTAKSIGIGLKNDKYEVVIPKNSTIPILKKETYTTTVDNQTSIALQIYEGNNEKAHLNRKVIDLEFGSLTPAKAGVAKIEVCFDVDAQNVLRIKTTDLATGKTIQAVGDNLVYMGLDLVLKNKMQKMIKRWIDKKIK